MGEAETPDLEALKRKAVYLGRKEIWGLEGIRLNSRILEVDPDDFGALYRRGKCYEMGDDFPAAKEDYSRALLIKPGTKYAEEALRRIQRGWAEAEERAEKARTKRRAEARAEAARRAERARARAEEAREKKRAEERRAAAERARAEDFRRVEAMVDFEEAYRFGVVVSKGSDPDYELATAAFKKAWELDPRKNYRQGGRPDPGLFEVPTRLARVYRKSGELDLAQRTYEWVLRHNDSRFAKVGLAAVHEDCGKHARALELYEEVLARVPRDSYALRGMAKALSSLGRVEEAVEAYEEAAKVSGGEGRDFAAAVAGLENMREGLRREGETDRARWIHSVVLRLRNG